MHLETTPLLPVAACLTAGIAVGEGQGQGIPWPCILLVWIMLTLLCKRWALIQTIAIWTGCFLLGMSVIQCQSQHVVEGPVVEGIVMSEPAEKPKTIAVDLLVPGQGGQTMRCYLWKDERSRSLQLGDALVIDDYQGPFVRSRNWQQGGEARQQLSRWQRLRLWFLQERHRLLDRYQALNGDEAAYAVLAAMTLGDKSALTPELRETYSVSGASHVLALSGLHLGIIYMLLTWLSMGRRRYWLSQLLMVTAIWAFALLTGLSPSITRSATMISLYALFSTRSNGRVSLNIICFTAIVMLLADAHALFEVSFQLSFMAVLSIVTLMPLWNRVWQPRHPVANWLWQLTSMSVSAQLGVAPLIAFHFGRFSTYFLLTNFLVIPAATIIIYGAVLMLVTPSVGSALIWFVWQLNDALSVIAKLPYASIDGLHPSAAQVGIIYALTAIFCRIIYILTNAGYRSGWPRSSRG